MLNNLESPVRFQVIVEGKILTEKSNAMLAEMFLDTLDESDKIRAYIVPVTGDGQRVLLG